MTTITERVNAAIGNTNKGALAALKKQRFTQPAPTNARADVTARIIELALAGETIPLDIGRPVVDAERELELLQVRQGLIDSAINELEIDNDENNQTNADKALDILREELVRIIRQVRELAPALRGITTEQAAITSGDEAVQAYRDLLTLVDQYGEIRRLQSQIVRSYDPHDPGLLKTLVRVGIIADSIHQLPHWGERRFAAARESNSTPATEAYIAWLLEGHQNDWTWEETQKLDSPADFCWPTDQPWRHLLRLADQMTPWMPSIAHLRLASTLANDATTFVKGRRREEPQDELRALAAYCELTGAQFPKSLRSPFASAADARAEITRRLSTQF